MLYLARKYYCNIKKLKEKYTVFEAYHPSYWPRGTKKLGLNELEYIKKHLIYKIPNIKNSNKIDQTRISLFGRFYFVQFEA